MTATADQNPRLDGLRAVVTGSTRGLGRAIALDLAARGARLIVNGRTAEACEALATEVGGRPVPGSVAEESTAARLIEASCEAYGGIDLVVNNAGHTRDAMLTRMTSAAFDEVIAVHLRGTWLVSKAAATAMRDGGGAIVNIVSGSALYGHIGQSNYAAAKGGVLALTRALTLELARSQITVNAVAPLVLTDMTRPLLAFAGERPELAEMLGAPEAVAPLVAFLGSSAGRAVTGQVLGFDGRRLTVWTHPVIMRAEDRDQWSIGDIAEAIASGALAELRPDPLGQAVQALMGHATPSPSAPTHLRGDDQ